MTALRYTLGMPLDVGTLLGRYEIRELLGAGGMGEVYRARDAQLDRDVAVKVLPSEVAESSAALERFKREARAVDDPFGRQLFVSQARRFRLDDHLSDRQASDRYRMLRKCHCTAPG